MNEILAHRQLQIASRDEILSAFGCGPYRATQDPEWTLTGRWVVLGPYVPGEDYPLGWTWDHGEEALIAEGLTEEHARLLTEALNVNFQVRQEARR